MPVLSPHHSSPSYRSSYNSSLDRPTYYNTTSITPRISNYSERFTTRSYIDSEGRRTISRSGSITEDGVKTRFKEEIRDGSTVRRDSLSRDPGVSSIRENSVLDFGSRREGSLSRDNSRLSSVELLDDLTDFRNKYSPSNYVPAIHRKNDNIIGRSKSINDIGLPPIEKAKKKVTDGINTNMSVSPTTTATNDNSCNNDDNGNRASVADLRKRFDSRLPENKVSKTPVNIETTEVKLSDNKFKILDQSNLKVNGEKIPNGLRTVKKSSLPKATLKKTSLKTDDTKLDHSENHVKIIKIAGVHKETDEQTKPNLKLQKINVDKQKNEKKATTTEKKTTTGVITEKKTNLDKVKTKTVTTKDVDTVDSSSVKINGEQGKLTNGIVDLKKVTLDTSKECDNGGSKVEVNGIGIGSSSLSLNEELASGGVSRTNNFASYISSKNLEGGDKQSSANDKGLENSNESEIGYVDKPAAYAKAIFVAVLLVFAATAAAAFVRGFCVSMARRKMTGRYQEIESVGFGGSASSYTDLASSPKTNKNRLSPSPSGATNNVGTSGALNTNSLGRKSLEREKRSGLFDEDTYERSPGLSYRLGTSSPTTVCTATSVKTLGLNGLKNIGNTCFMNSVIQCLSNTKQLSEYLRQDLYIKDINTTNSSMKGSLIKAFAEVIKELWAEDSCDRAVNTASLKGQIQRFAPRFMGFAQQDAQEFLRYLLEGLHEDVNRVTEKPKPIHTEIDDKLNDLEKSAESWNRYLRMDNSRIVDIFVGQLKSTLKCTFCGHCSVTFDPFWDLSLSLPTRTGQLRLSQCLESFTREETLDGDEKPTCSKCKERRKCTKSFSIQKFPKILVIHLKRFSPTERFRGKLNVTVDFPLEGLDMSKYAADEVTVNKYNLYAVSNHSGTTYSGHYTAYCRHPYAMSWHEYNDSRVSSVSTRSVVSSEAYVLFYEQEGQKSHL